jgi:hypothetical protein
MADSIVGGTKMEMFPCIVLFRLSGSEKVRVVMNDDGDGAVVFPDESTAEKWRSMSALRNVNDYQIVELSASIV